MSRTLDELEEDLFLFPVRVGLAPGQMPLRRLYVTKDFGKWARALSDRKQPGRLLSERAQLATVFSDFLAGHPLSGIITAIDPPAGMGLVKLKTPTLRLRGWSAASQTMVLVDGARKQDIKDGHALKDREAGKKVIAIRQAMGAPWDSGKWYELFRS